MHALRFDPFEDRLSRDIRNALSESFMESLDSLDMAPVKKTAAQFFSRSMAPCYRTYIKNRLSMYEKAVQIIKVQGLSEPFKQSLLLWDLDLFFEVHERVERLWMKARGHQRKALQGMVQAAGFYIHLAFDHEEAARKMAAKAALKLAQYGDSLPCPLQVNTLLAALEQNDPNPPKLSGCHGKTRPKG